jgi:hypothetical protein
MTSDLPVDYAFGGGGSGDSTRERDDVTKSVGSSLCQDPLVRSLSATWIALLEQVLIAGQQSVTGWSSLGTVFSPELSW